MTVESNYTAVELVDVNLSFQQQNGESLKVLDAISLQVQSGEIVALLGPSGCGKTTLLKVVAGLLPIDSGQVLISGCQIIAPTYRSGYVPQSYSLFPWLTVQENIEYGMQCMGLEPSERMERVANLLTLTDLNQFASAYPSSLSGGMQQRVAIARALAVDPDLILLDEPFGALDILTRIEMQEHFLHLTESTHKAVIFVTHNIDEAVYVADKIIFLSPRPMRISKTIEIPFSRPRELNLRTSEQFMRLVQSVQLEILASMSH